MHSFCEKDAQKYGILEAVLLQNIKFWIAKNKANRKHFYDGSYWTYNSSAAFAEQFPYASTHQIYRALKRLIDDGVLKTGNYNPNPYDRTCWYTFTQDCNIHFADLQNGKCNNAKSTNTDINTDIKPDKAATPEGFAEFWKSYPKKTAKPAAIRAFKAAKLKKCELEIILKDIELKKATWTDPQFIPHPATYLNQRRWEDVVMASEAPKSMFAGGI